MKDDEYDELKAELDKQTKRQKELQKKIKSLQ